jgi:putative membrane protein
MNYLNIFPHLNASLNALSGVFLMLGFYFIQTKKVSKHRICMLAASSVSALFLVCYITHHSIRTYYFGLGPTRFTGEGVVAPIYKTILLTHTILATVIAPFVIVTLWRALKGKFEIHKKLARWVFPIWLYVSVTGVIVYLMLYQLFPAR